MSSTATPDVLDAVEIGADVDAIFEDMWAVLVWNDDTTTFEQVILALVMYFEHTPEEAEGLAWQVHRKGKAVVAVLSEKSAEKGVNVLLNLGIQATKQKA